MTRWTRRLWLAGARALGRDVERFAPHGIEVRLPRGLDPELAYKLARGRPYEAAEAGLIARHLPAGVQVIELGGCLGVISALIRSRIGPAPRHLVVEANPKLLAACRANAERGAAPGAAEVIHAAIDYSGAPTVTFAFGHNAHVGAVGGAGAGGVAVPALRLADLVARLDPGPWWLVCDIEGAELAMLARDGAALAGAGGVVIETHPDRYPQGAADLAALRERLAALGFVERAAIEDVLLAVRTGAGDGVTIA